jgi:hypothetical protein
LLTLSFDLRGFILAATGFLALNRSAFFVSPLESARFAPTAFALFLFD